jgi:hypothetical protein
MTRILKALPFFCMACLPLAAESPPTLDEGLRSLYNFDFPGAQASLDRYIGAHPQEPLPYVFRGAAYLFYELNRLGALESEFLTDDDRLVEKARPQPDPNVRRQFLQALADVQQRADVTLKSNPNDRDTLFALSLSQAMATDYMALVEKRQISSLSTARRSNGYAQRVLKIDPNFYDAYLTTGFSEYMVGSLPFFLRWFIHFDNVDGNKNRAVQNLELVASRGHYLQPLAKIFLGIIDLREKKPQEARRLLAELAHDYPGNPLYRKELDKLNGK